MAIEITTIKQQIEDFNRKYLVGLHVTYIDEGGKPITAKIRFPAEMLEGVGPVVWVSSRVGCVKLDNVILSDIPITEPSKVIVDDEDFYLGEIG